MARAQLSMWSVAHPHVRSTSHPPIKGVAEASSLEPGNPFGRDGAETKEIGRRWLEAGYTAVKLGWEPMGRAEALDIELVRGARQGVGDQVALLIDAGCVWDARTALPRAEAFADYNIGWLEEPLRQNDVDGYVWLRDRSPVPIAAGEGECGRESFRALIAESGT